MLSGFWFGLVWESTKEYLNLWEIYVQRENTTIMAIKQSLIENKSFILESLPTQELKDEFLKSLENAPDKVASPSVEDQLKEAQAPEHVGEELYDSIKKELENYKPAAPMSKEDEKKAIEEELKHVSKSDASEEK